MHSCSHSRGIWIGFRCWPMSYHRFMPSSKIKGSLCCNHQRVLLCSHARKYHCTSLPVPDTERDTYRVSTYICDKKNARGSNSSGKTLKERNSTLDDATFACTAKLVIRFDGKNFLSCLRSRGHQSQGSPTNGPKRDNES